MNAMDSAAGSVSLAPPRFTSIVSFHSCLLVLAIGAAVLLLRTPAATAGTYYVSPSGNNASPGSRSAPWKTVTASLSKLSAGDTLYIRAGTYYEQPKAAVSGTPSAPIVVRSFPGERVIIDSGHAEFQNPGNSEWVLVNAQTGEYRSQRKYANALVYGYVAGIPGYENERVALVPYEKASHFRATTDQYNPTAFYVGPGTFRDTTGYIHIRLAKTSDLKATELRYGQVFASDREDPSRYALVLSQASYTLQIGGAHWVFKDLALHQAKRTIQLSAGAHHILLEGFTVWSGARAIGTTGPNVHEVKITQSRIYGDNPYWIFWSDMKDAPAPANALRSTSIDLRDGAHDWEISYNHIRGSGQDLIGTATQEYNIDIHHNRIENCGDDALEIEGTIDVGRVAVYGNYIANALVAIAPAQDTPSFTGPLLVYRNVIALLRTPPVNRAEGINHWNGGFRFGFEYMFKHGSGSKDNSANAHYYHNTLVMLGTAGRGLNITPKIPDGVRIANNLMVMVNGVVNRTYRLGPGLVVNGNLYWKMNNVDEHPLLGSYDNVEAFHAATDLESQGIGSTPKRGTDPKFADLPLVLVGTTTKEWGLSADSERLGPADFLLSEGSPARDAGIVIPPHASLGRLPDTHGSRDIGAIPYGTSGSAFAYFPFALSGPPLSGPPQATTAGFAPAKVTPNPVRGSGLLHFSTARAGWVRVDLFDVSGRSIARPLGENLAAGSHRIPIGGKGPGIWLEAGVYFYRIASPEGVTTGRFFLIN